ncbi:substrate-binding domain-containing protein [Pectobacterium actinidiae]|uniref:substrate-binding domain-containing protein n=1 Tax=Pectobacterium actinidiae TaxID=1507808 RepID=UPI0038208FE7
MPIDLCINPLQIAVSTGILPPELATLLATQRAEEPETPVQLIATTEEDQLQGLEDGRYCLGLLLSMNKMPASRRALALWQDELAIALPFDSPLLACAEVPLIEAVHYPLIMWNKHCCAPLSEQIDSLMTIPASPLNVVDRVKSFEMMAVLVAAGYGIGFATRSRIACSRKLEIVMRPLANGPHQVTTFLTLPPHPAPAAVERLIQRAQAITPH